MQEPPKKLKIRVLKFWFSLKIKILLWVFVAGYTAGCISFQDRPIPRELIEEPIIETQFSWEILDYRNRGTGGSIPNWLSSYLEDQDIAAVENLEEFENYYLFITMNSGTNLNALEQWNTGFSTELDFPRLVAIRIENQFLRAARSYPDDEYGSFYIALIRSASDALWEGAIREDDFWLLRSFSDYDDPEHVWENIDFFILIKVEKSLLNSQITRLLSNIRPEDSLSSDQQMAVNRVRENFFQGF